MEGRGEARACVPDIPDVTCRPFRGRDVKKNKKNITDVNSSGIMVGTAGQKRRISCTHNTTLLHVAFDRHNYFFKCQAAADVYFNATLPWSTRSLKCFIFACSQLSC